MKLAGLVLLGSKSGELHVGVRLLIWTQWLRPLVVRLTLPPPSPIRKFIIPLLRWCIQQQLRQELVAKCQGLLPPPVVFTSSSRPSVSNCSSVLPPGERGFSPAPPWHGSSLKCSFDSTFVQVDNEGLRRDEKKKKSLCTVHTVRAHQCLYTFVWICAWIYAFIMIYLYVFPLPGYCLLYSFIGFIQRHRKEDSSLFMWLFHTEGINII